MGVQVKEVLETLSNGTRVSLDVMVKSMNTKKAKNGSEYLDLMLTDVTGAIAAKMWGVTEEGERLFRENRYLRVHGKTNEFMGVPQLIIEDAELIPEGELVEENLIISAPEPVDKLVVELERYVGELKDPLVSKVVDRLYSRNKEDFIKYPAAKGNHHAYISGLLYHTVSMLRLAKYNIETYGGLDPDIMYGAIVLHDMGKIREYSDPHMPEFTDVGKKIGHVVLMAGEIRAVAGDLRKEDKSISLDKLTDLIHGVLAHHGKKEWGSPVEPQTKEAEIIHQIDMMDSRMNMDM